MYCLDITLKLNLEEKKDNTYNESVSNYFERKQPRSYIEGEQVHFRLRFGTINTWEARAARFHMLIIKSGALRQGLGSARKHQNRGGRAGESQEGGQLRNCKKMSEMKETFPH